MENICTREQNTHQKDFLFWIDKIEFWVLVENICAREQKTHQRDFLFWIDKIGFRVLVQNICTREQNTHQKDFLFWIDKIEFWVSLQIICAREKTKKNSSKMDIKNSLRPVRTLAFHQPPALSAEGRSSGKGTDNRSCRTDAAIALRKASNFSSSGMWVLSMLENTDQMYAL